MAAKMAVGTYNGSDEIPHRTAPDPQKFGEGSPQPGKTMGSPYRWASVIRQ